MRPPTTAPEVTEEDFAGSGVTKKRHPAFGLVGLSRRSGGHDRLFGSELNSGQTISLHISQAEEHWHLSEKRYYAKNIPMIEVEMTPSQFAELITTMNIGQGVPCTIRYADGAQVPNFVDADTLHDKIKEDLSKDTREVNDLVKKLQSDLEEVLASTGLSKAKKDVLTSTMNRIRQQVTSNMPFVLDQYHEAVDKVTASAKAEVEAYITHAVTSLGLKSLEDIVSSRAALTEGEAK